MKFHQYLASLTCGVVFAVGLGIARALHPETIRGFLDFFGNWDPTLAIMFAGGSTTYGLIAWFARGIERPVLAEKFALPRKSNLDRRLFLGASLFGIGWGMAGVRPGPAVIVALWNTSVLVFAVALMAGIALFELAVKARLERQGSTKPTPKTVAASCG